MISFLDVGCLRKVMLILNRQYVQQNHTKTKGLIMDWDTQLQITEQ